MAFVRRRKKGATKGNLRYLGNDQIRFSFSDSLIESLWGKGYRHPHRYTAHYLGDEGGVILIPVHDPDRENENARSVSSNSSTSFPLAHALWTMVPQGRSFTAKVVDDKNGSRAVIKLDDVEEEFTYLRLEPGNPFRTPLEHVMAGRREERKRGRVESEDSIKPVQTDFLPQSPVNIPPPINGIPSPRAFGFGFDTFDEWLEDFHTQGRKFSAGERIYFDAATAIRKSQKEVAA